MNQPASCGKNLLVRVTLGIVLLVSAFLKTISPVESLLLTQAYGMPAWSGAVFVHAEILLACLLLGGAFPRYITQATLVLFVIFACFSFYRALAGYESCGCFGAVKITPWWTLLFDLAAIVALAVTIPPRTPLSSKNLYYVAVPYACLASAAYFSRAPQPPVFDNLAEQTSVSDLVILEPEKWIGAEFPLRDLLTPPALLGQGDWTLLVHHHDCAKCLQARPRYESLHDSGSDVLLIEVPPFGSSGPIGKGKPGHAWLPDDRDWFVQAPIELRLLNGVVVSASLDLPTLSRGQP